MISRKYKLLLINPGLLYRYASMLILKHKPKKTIIFKRKFDKYLTEKFLKNFSEISEHVGYLAKKKNKIINKQNSKNIIKRNKRICVEGRDIASKILSKNPKYRSLLL